MRERGDLREGLPIVDLELRRRGVDTPGVQEAVAAGWDRCVASEQQYDEILDTSNAACRRSDLTSEETLLLYSSFFDDSTPMSKVQMTYMLGETPVMPGDRKEDEDSKIDDRVRTMDDLDQGVAGLSFVERAALLGLNIPSRAEIQQQKATPLFSFVEGRRGMPSGFEQINEDLFARKDNKFMVFNGAAMDSWSGTEPMTKVTGIEEEILLFE
jgi:hypothetical protein